jgi:hypothetical protein
MRFENAADTRLWLAQQRQQELIHRAESSRLARCEPLPSTECGDAYGGLRAWFGRLFVSAGRALRAGEAPSNDPCPDVAF